MAHLTMFAEREVRARVRSRQGWMYTWQVGWHASLRRHPPNVSKAVHLRLSDELRVALAEVRKADVALARFLREGMRVLGRA